MLYEEPYRIKQTLGHNAYVIEDLDGTIKEVTYNVANLKSYI